jgi:cytochrome b involved in lipid metabolism
MAVKEKKMASDPKLHTFDEVSKHNKTKDCWLILSGKVCFFLERFNFFHQLLIIL